MTNLTVWRTPLRSAFETDRWVRDFFGPATADDWLPPARNGFRPAAEVAKDGDDAVVRLELPGVDVDNDVTVELDNGRLTVRGERRDEYGDQDGAGDAAKDRRVVHELRYGTFSRSFTVPAHVSGDAVSASYDAGVLTVRVAGVYAGTEPQRIAITR